MIYTVECERCGQTFTAHRAATQNPPRFCSKECFYPGLETRILEGFDRGEGCWRWKGRTQFGYGIIWRDGKATKAHRVVYELLVGPIPSGYELDHACHTNDPGCSGGITCPHRACVRPDHLEPVTPRENWIRGNNFSAINARKTTCPRGHAYDPRWREKYGECRICGQARRNAATRRWRQRQKDLQLADRP